MLEIGDLVVCVDANPKKGSVGAIVPVHTLLEVGRVYRIIDFHLPTMAKHVLTGERFVHFDSNVSLILEAIVMPPPMGGFSAYRFRKLPRVDAPEQREAGTPHHDVLMV